MMAATPAQNASGEMPVSGAASLAMKSNRTGAIWQSVGVDTFHDVFLARSGNSVSRFQEVCSHGNGAKRAAPMGPFNAKALPGEKPQQAISGRAGRVGACA